MNILWVKDNKQGHLKQVRALLEEIKKLININISELDIDSKLFKKRISPSLIESKNLVIGAGHTVYPYLLKSKKINPDIKSIAILSPTYFKKKFDLMTDKERSYYSHPAFWAPFSLVGDGATLN